MPDHSSDSASQDPTVAERIHALGQASDPAACLTLHGQLERALTDADSTPPGLDEALASAGLQAVRAGPSPALVLAPSRGELWREGEAVASLGRSRLLFRLLDFLATQGPTADRERLYTEVWDQLYLGDSSDNTLHVALNRLRKKLKQSGIQVVPTPLGGFAIEGQPAVLRWHPDKITNPPAIAAPTNLTAHPDPIIGRQAELDQVHAHFSAGGRMLTVVGTGGAGKTRLVRTAGLLAAGAVGAPPGGIWFIDLSEQRTREGMVQAMAQVLDLSLQDCTTSEAALSQLQQAIAQRGHSWLILDNLEQLVDVAREMVDHLGSVAPEIRWLLTSREHLGLPEEEVLSLGPLPAVDGAQLFLDHATAIRPDLVPSPALRVVAESICTAVDGIPLAIELAAARARILAPAQILDRLSEALKLLAAPNRKGPARHSTLRATLGWSWDLLTPPERTCLAQLSVFHGGFTADAAEAVVQPSEGPDAPWTVDLLEALVDQSLLHPMPALGDARLTMYRSVQEFAQEKLAMGGKEEAAARHLHWAITEGERRLGQQWTSKEPEATQALRHERDNLFAAHAAASSPDAIIRTALVLAHLLWSTGPRSTLARVLQNAEGVCSEAPELAAKVGLQQGLLLHQSGQTEAGEALLLATLQHVRATGDLGLEASILRALADLNYDQADYAEAQSQFERAAELSGQAGDRGLQGNHLTTVGNLHRLLNRTEQARDCLERGLAIHREVGDQRSEATALVGLASLASLLGAEEEALSRNEQALQIFHAIGDARGESYLLENLGNLHTSAGRSDEAMAAYERALDIAQSRGMILHQAAIATNLAMAHLDVGELAAAEDLLRQALLAHRSHGRRLYEGAAMIRLAMVLLDRGRHDPAQPLLDGAVEILEQIGAPRYAAYGQAWRGLCRALEGESTEAEADIAAAEQALGEAGDALGQTLCDLLRGHLRPGTAGGLIARAQALGPPSGDHPSGSPAPAARSVEIRLAIRLLERRSG